MLSKDYLQELLTKYRQGKCTPEETQLLWQWLFLLDARDQQELSGEEEHRLYQQSHDRIFRHVLSPAGDDTANDAVATPFFPIQRHFFRRRTIATAAAAAVILIVIATFLLRHNGGPLAGRSGSSIVNSGQDPTTIYLPDSTQVILNRYASVTYDENYNKGNRVVRLSGEAYFTVRQNPRLAFVVRTGALETQALGTAFNIEYYPEETEIRVSLLQGKVKVTSSGDHRQVVFLDSGQMALYKLTGDSLQQPIPIAASNVLAWTKGGLVFNDIPLAEALRRVEEHYHLHLVYAPSCTEGKTVTTVFSDQMSWEGALSNILFLHNLHYSKKDSLILIK